VDPLFWVVLGATALSGFFSLASYALRGFRRAQLEEVFEGPSGRKRLATMEAHLTPLRLTSSLCRALANLALVVAMIYLLDGAHSASRAVGATLAAGVIIAVISVGIAHAWAAYAAERILAAALPILMVLRWALWPVIVVMMAFDVPIRRLAGADGKSNDNGDNAKQEILQAATEGRAEGAVEQEEVEMIESVMEFGDTDAGKIMTPRTDIFALPVETPWHDACRAVFEAGHTRVPVYDGGLDNIIGVLYAKDLLQYFQRDESVTTRQIMRKPFFVPETKALDDLLREFRRRKVHLSIVLDEYGGTAGLVTIEDVLEEIVGDISDEYDEPEAPDISRVDEQTIEVDGRVHIDDVNDVLDLEIPEDEDYDTLAGFVVSDLGYIPAVDETLEACAAKFTVLDADERKIMRLRVEALPADGQAEDD